MTLKKYFLWMALGGIFAFTLQSCDDDNNDGIAVPDELKNALSQKYPHVKSAEWQTKGTYYVADFRDNNYDVSAWFTTDGVWQMTEIDIPYTALPAAVKTSFEISPYATWRKDDVDKLERKGVETIYVVEVEQGKQEMDLYFTEAGLLVKEVIDVEDDDSEDYLTTEPSAAIKAFIAEKYPNARIVEIDVENGRTEVDIVHNNVGKEVLFSSDNWISTSWDIRKADLPSKVVDTANVKYPGYLIDDVDFVETPTDAYYFIEMEQGEREVNIKVKADGTILA